MVKQYSKMSLNDFDDNLNQLETIDDIVTELTNNDLSYHFRIHPNTTYIFFGDLDNYPNTMSPLGFHHLRYFLYSDCLLLSY